MTKNYIQLSSIYDNGWSVTIDRIIGTAEMLKGFLSTKIARLIPYNIAEDAYTLFEENPNITDEFKLKSLYRGQTYIRIPVIIEKSDNGLFTMTRWSESSDQSFINAYIIIDKRVLKEAKRANKKLDKEQIHTLAMNKVDSLIKGFNMISNGEMYRCVIKNDGSEVQTINYIPKNDPYEMTDYILDKLSIVNLAVDRLIKETVTESLKK